MKYRCGLIGLGRIGCGFDDVPNEKSINTHAGAYTKINDAEFVSLCDMDKDKLKKYGKKYNITSLYSDIGEMLKKEQLDCISICTLADSHLSIVREASKHKIKGIFLEKPISLSLNDAKKIIDVCKKKNITLQIDHQRRFSPFYKKIKKMITDGKLGHLQSCSIYYGSGIANTGSHIFDLINYFFGGIKWIQGTESKNRSNNQNDPNIDGKFECKNGLICSIQSFDYNKFAILEMDIIGTKARIRLNLTESTGELFEISKKLGLAYKKLDGKKELKKNDNMDIVLGVKNLFKSIQNKEQIICSGYDGYASLEAIIAIRLSAQQNGGKIDLPIRSNKYKISSR
jgi:predicted dehydrogenase